MNAARRNKLIELLGLISTIKSLLDGIMSEEDDARESMPENLQGSSRYEESEEASDKMSDAFSSLCEAYDYIYDIL